MGLVVVNVNPLNVYVNTWMATGGILDMLFDLVLFSFPIILYHIPRLKHVFGRGYFSSFPFTKNALTQLSSNPSRIFDKYLTLTIGFIVK